MHRGVLLPMAVATALLPAVLAGPAEGQGSAGLAIPDTLRLADALELARRLNPDLRRAEHETDRASAAELSGWGSFLPTVGTTASLVDASSTTVTARNEFGQPVALDDPAKFSATSAVGSIGASLTLFDGFRGVNELQAARAQSRAAEAGVEGESVRVEAEVRRRFYRAVAAERLVDVEERLTAAAEERLEATEAMAQAGRATPQDVLGAEVDLARQQMSMDNARGAAHTAALLLAELIGVSGGANFVVAGDLPNHSLPEELDVDVLVAAALAASPRVQRAEAMASRADHAADAARGGLWPTIRLNAGYSREISLVDASQLGSFPWNRGFSLGLSAGLPVFSGFETRARIVDARVSQDNAAEDLRRTRLAIEREVRVGFTELELANRSVRLAERASELSVRRLDTGQEGFRRGLITFTELQQLIEQAAQSERAAVRARLEYAAAAATLDEAVGRPVLGTWPTTDH